MCFIQTLCGIVDEIHYRVKPENNGAEMPSIRKMKPRIPIELGPNVGDTFCKTVNGQMRQKVLCKSEILTTLKQTGMEAAMKRECLGVINT